MWFHPPNSISLMSLNTMSNEHCEFRMRNVCSAVVMCALLNTFLGQWQPNHMAVCSMFALVRFYIQFIMYFSSVERMNNSIDRTSMRQNKTKQNTRLFDVAVAFVFTSSAKEKEKWNEERERERPWKWKKADGKCAFS